jgi:hypothetical protein
MPKTTHSTYAIGDLQGCDQQLAVLLEQIKLQQTHTTKFIFVGDLVNRGPQSRHTLQRIRALGGDAEMVLGNHDLHLLAVAKGIRKAHASDTFGDILNSPDCDAWIDWLRHQPLALFKNNHLIVHAGVLPQWTTQQTLELAREVETCLQGPDWVDFLREMYGNTPRQWNDNLPAPMTYLQDIPRLVCRQHQPYRHHRRPPSLSFRSCPPPRPQYLRAFTELRTGDVIVHEDHGVARFAASLGNIERVDVLPFHQLGKFKWEQMGMKYELGDTPTPTPEATEAAKAQFRQHGLNCPS